VRTRCEPRTLDHGVRAAVRGASIAAEVVGRADASARDAERRLAAKARALAGRGHR
jgi:hypothetical protein